MKGAHSIKKKRSGKKAALIILIIIVLALAGCVAYFLITGAQNPVTDFIASLQTTQEDKAANALADADDDADDTDEDAQSTSAASSASASVEPITYTNPIFGYRLTLPAGFVEGSDIDDGAGKTFTSKSMHMTVTARGYNNEGETADDVMNRLWNGDADSIARVEGDRVVIYQYDTSNEYFYWVTVGAGAIDELEIRYPLQDDNRDELNAAQSIMQSFVPGDVANHH